MFIFGVTGGIGCGKSAVCSFLKVKSLTIIKADPLAKELTNRSPEIRHALKAEFGEDVYSENGQLNKEKLSKLVFYDSGTREKVNRIIHPHVIDWIKAEAQRLYREAGQELIGVEAALIFESNMVQMLDAVVVVSAPLEDRIHWLQKRNNLSREEIFKRIKSQMPLTKKIKRADYVIKNDGTLEDLEKKVDLLYQWLRQRAGT